MAVEEEEEEEGRIKFILHEPSMVVLKVCTVSLKGFGMKGGAMGMVQGPFAPCMLPSKWRTFTSPAA